MKFFCVYIQEAHAVETWQVLGNVWEEIAIGQPETDDERAEIAGLCMLKLDIEMPMLLDNMENEVDAKYAALPERLYVLDADGKVFFKGVMGSRGFNVDTWLEAVQAQAALSEAQAAE